MTVKNKQAEIPKLLVLDLSHRYGGASERAISLLKELPSDRAALASLEDTPVTQRAQECGLQVYTLGKNKLDLGISSRLSTIVRENGIDIIDSQNPQSRYWASLVSARTGVKHVATLNSWPRKEYGKSLKGKVYGVMDSVASKHTHHFIAVSAEIANEIVSTGIPAENVTTIANAIKVDAVHPIEDGHLWRRTHGLPEDAIVCCAVGRLTEVKGFRYLMDAFATLGKEFSNLHCLILGDGDQYKTLTARIKELGLQERVRLLGNKAHDEVLAIVQQSDMFVMPSLSEGTPLALLEACALGRPIVASNVGGIPEVVVEGQNGKLIPPANAEALKESLLWMCKNPEQASQLGKNAQQTIAEKFAMSRMVEELLTSYEKAISQRLD